MAENKKSFVLYANYIDLLDGYEEDGEHIDGMTDEEAGKWIKTIFRYVNDRNPIIPNEIKQAFILVRKDLKQDLKKYQAKVISMENARKSNRNHIENKLKSNSNQLEINSDNVNDNVNDNDNEDIYNDILSNNEEELEIFAYTLFLQDLEKLLNRTATIYEKTKINKWITTYHLDYNEILEEVKNNLDKNKPIEYIDKALMNASTTAKTETIEEKQDLSGSAWLDEFNKQWRD